MSSDRRRCVQFARNFEQDTMRPYLPDSNIVSGCMQSESAQKLQGNVNGCTHLLSESYVNPLSHESQSTVSIHTHLVRLQTPRLPLDVFKLCSIVTYDV